jgi:fructose-bisphosphate aldolase class II
MPIVHLPDILKHAYHHSYAVGAFGVDNPPFLEGVLEAAEASRAPVILNLIESHFSEREFDLFVPAIVAAARASHVPVAINFDHGTSPDRAKSAIAAGCNSVMVDTSAKPFSDNLHLTREIVALAHACGIAVEGELGYVPGVEGESAEEHPGELAYTSATEAKTFVERTGVDCLAVSVGTVHGHMKGVPRLDYSRLAKIHEAIPTPLVIHGGTGLSDDQFRKLISHGIAKINYYTGLADVASQCIRRNASCNRNGGYGVLMAGVRDAIRKEAERCIRVWGSGGRAAEVLAQCRAWQEVEHVGLFYAMDSLTQGHDIASVMREAKASLTAIPGVRDIRIGRALQLDGKYRYCWRVTLANAATIESFQNHHVRQTLVNKAINSLEADWVTLNFVEI